ncbi:MAG: hypothetical protein GEV06_24860 [Luteitalea sp.]|nr:hypothetical protein [Luteitalea sp.]
MIALALYAIATIAYIWRFVHGDQPGRHVPTLLLVGAVVVHTFVIGMQSVQVGAAPFAGRSGAVSTFVWMLALVYLYTELSTEEMAIGVFIAPLLTLLQIIPAFTASAEEHPALLDNPLFAVHVASVLLAYASFALAFVVAVTYVLLFRELKRRTRGMFFSRLPSLQVLDVMNVRAVTVGWACLTLGLVAGAWWVAQARMYAADDPHVQAMSLLDPTILIACLSWMVYTLLLVGRRVRGWSGRRAAWLSAFGFVLILLNFLPVGYFLSRSHGFV